MRGVVRGLTTRRRRGHVVGVRGHQGGRYCGRAAGRCTGFGRGLVGGVSRQQRGRHSGRTAGRSSGLGSWAAASVRREASRCDRRSNRRLFARKWSRHQCSICRLLRRLNGGRIRGRCTWLRGWLQHHVRGSIAGRRGGHTLHRGCGSWRTNYPRGKRRWQGRRSPRGFRFRCRGGSASRIGRLRGRQQARNRSRSSSQSSWGSRRQCSRRNGWLRWPPSWRRCWRLRRRKCRCRSRRVFRVSWRQRGRRRGRDAGRGAGHGRRGSP